MEEVAAEGGDDGAGRGAAGLSPRDPSSVDSDRKCCEDTVAAAVISQAREARELYVPTLVPRVCLAELGGPLGFFRNYVHLNSPVVITDVVPTWPAFQRWASNEYLCRAMSQAADVSVDVSPAGYGDYVHDGRIFVLPHEETAPFHRVLSHVERNDPQEAVWYLSHQNDCLAAEYRGLLGDVPSSIDWADTAFAGKPDAANFWLGGPRSISSLHRDHYENLMGVVRGCKRFILYPPCDAAFMEERDWPVARFTATGSIVPEPRAALRPWIPVDPLRPAESARRYPAFRHARAVHVDVAAGEMLYLPALWYHHVRQDSAPLTIAVNYWYDMQFGPSYAFLNALEALPRRGLVSFCSPDHSSG